jgi:predicted TIM-barrel fold metal-dependent hydrolase
MGSVIRSPAVDVHCHFLSPAYRDALAAAGIDRPDGFPHVPAWEIDSALAAMDEVGIAVAMLSVSSPGVHFVPGEATRLLARQVNEDGAAVVRERPDRFGLLASLPLPDVDAALAEIAYASDVLGADGFVLMTNYDGVYVGNEVIEPVIAELDRRQAVVAVHPTSPPGWEQLTLGRPRPMLEFPFDTTRMFVDLILSRTLLRYPRIRWIVPHVGSALTALVDRVDVFSSLFLRGDDDESAGVPAQLRGLYYDLTGPALPRALPALLALADPGRLLYGSDLPFPPPAAVQRMAEDLATTDILDAEVRHAMFATNALTLFPRLQGFVGDEPAA